jgi:hypothetical protein
MIFNYNIAPFINRNRNGVLMIFFIFASFSIVSAQTTKEEAPSLRERLFYGGSLGLQFGTITDIQVSPVIGLWLLPRLAVAAGPDYRFYKFADAKTNIYGGRGYLQFVVIQNLSSIVPIGANTGIFLHLEDEVLSLESTFWNKSFDSYRFAVNTVLAGGGISQQIGRRSSINLIFLWALNDPGVDLYSNPEIRISFIF